MTSQEFITSIEAKPLFIKWAEFPTVKEVIGTIQKWEGKAYINTGAGRNIFSVWFVEDTETNEAFWQNQDQLQPETNPLPTKQTALENYLKANFDAYFLTSKLDLVNNWAEAEVLIFAAGKLTRKNVLVFKRGNNPITHLEII